MTDSANNNEMRWDLESIFPGGSGSPEYKSYRENLKTKISGTSKEFENLPEKLSADNRSEFVNAILNFQDIIDGLELVYSFASCLISQDVEDTDALGAMQEFDVMHSQFGNLQTKLEAIARACPDDQWSALLADGKLKSITFGLDEIRKQARQKMSKELESFANDLAVDGFHAWNRLYDKMAGDLRVDFEEDGETKTLSLGQLASKFDSPNRAIRKSAFEKLESAWETRAEYAAMILNALAGFRLTMYKNRNWESPLFEPTEMNRLQQKTLDAMWSAVRDGVPKLVPYVKAKKKMLGLDKFMWYDQTAPVGKSEAKISYSEAREFIIKNIQPFSQEMADFTKMALENRWVEAEDRPGKAAGGFCTGFGPKKESRIFMTFLDTYGDMMTLAHELGHAWHQEVLKDEPALASDYPMNLAETASIFNELLVTDAAFEAADNEDEKLMLLDQKLSRTHVLFSNIFARYLFDTKFYTARKNGVVSRKKLDELMSEAQVEAFGDTLDPSGRHPLFWASKLHFYLTGIPFYNFPYTFGFLFAGGVYDRAKKEGSGFFPKYKALLKDTGSMTTEDLAKKHLDVDLTKDDFWHDAVARMTADVDPFVKIAG